MKIKPILIPESTVEAREAKGYPLISILSESTVEAKVYSLHCQVLNLRVDITLLDFAGNVIDASCIAAMTALSHFRRPDFIVNGEEVKEGIYF